MSISTSHLFSRTVLVGSPRFRQGFVCRLSSAALHVNSALSLKIFTLVALDCMAKQASARSLVRVDYRVPNTPSA